MKKITETAVNRSSNSQMVDISALRNSGVSKDNMIFRPGDIIEIPDELNVMVDKFIPKGETEAKEYYMITCAKNNVPYDVTMTSFRRIILVTDDDKIRINSPVNDHIAQLGDDEQRARYLQGKTFRVLETIKCTNKWTDKPIYVPTFELVK